jgi:cell division protein FtsN|tara:strand:- start:1736 stop:2365 length:630 start_codon:yes stop_codon:yes gene_type:complete
MARSTRKRGNNRRQQGWRPLHDLILLTVGVTAGVIGAALYQGAISGDPDRMGAGIKQLLQDSREQAGKPETPLSATAGNAAPARTSFDFYTVLPEIEHVIPDTGDFEPPLAPASVETTAQPASKKTEPGSYYMLQAGAYTKPAQADRMKAKLVLTGFEVSIQHISVQDRGDFYRVRVGPYRTMGEMEAANRKLANMQIKALRLKVSRKP